jgi:hypothetical protein
MSLWKVAPVARQPALTLVRWRVLETETGNRHLTGWCVENQEGRVSSLVRTFDPATALAVTRSGRVYRLEGLPGDDRDASYVWLQWAITNKVAEVYDRTDDVYAELCGAQAP